MLRSNSSLASNGVSKAGKTPFHSKETIVVVVFSNLMKNNGVINLRSHSCNSWGNYFYSLWK
jgi:hypothetical protein